MIHKLEEPEFILIFLIDIIYAFVSNYSLCLPPLNFSSAFSYIHVLPQRICAISMPVIHFLG